MEPLHQYIKAARQYGHTDGQIRSNLTAAGWHDSHINTALGENQDVPTPHERAVGRGKKSGKKILELVLLVLFLSVVVTAGGIVAVKWRMALEPNPQSLTTAQVTAEGLYSDGIKAYFDADQRLILWPVVKGGSTSEVLLSKDAGNTWIPVPGSTKSAEWQLLGLSFAPSGMLKQNEEPRFIVGYAEPATEELYTFDLDVNGNVILANKRTIDTTNAYFGDGQWAPGKNGPTYEGLMSGSG